MNILTQEAKKKQAIVKYADKQGRKVTYTFDNSGNQVSKLNANG